MTLNNGVVYITRHGKSPPLPKLLQEIKLKNAIEVQMKIYERKQAEERIKALREPVNAEDIAKAYRNGGPIKPIDIAKEIDALLSKYR